LIPQSFYVQESRDCAELGMGIFFYVVLFFVTCFFGWWAKGSNKTN